MTFFWPNIKSVSTSNIVYQRKRRKSSDEIFLPKHRAITQYTSSTEQSRVLRNSFAKARCRNGELTHTVGKCHRSHMLNSNFPAKHRYKSTSPCPWAIQRQINYDTTPPVADSFRLQRNKDWKYMFLIHKISLKVLPQGNWNVASQNS